MEWCRARADELEEQERARTRKVTVAYDPTVLIAPGERRAFNCGYLFLQDAYCSLGLPAECARIAAERRFAYDLDAVLSRLVYGRVLEPGSKRATCEFAEGPTTSTGRSRSSPPSRRRSRPRSTAPARRSRTGGRACSTTTAPTSSSR